jgi:DNA-binding transcriptional LysR family regulator
VLTLVDATRLTVFREVACRGSFTAAATALGISQPAVSQHIAKLEQEIGTALVVRSGRGLRLTHPGEVLLRRSERLLAYLRETSDELAAVSGAEAGELRMVAFPSASTTIVPPAVGTFRRQFPQASVTLREAEPPEALPALLAGEYDLAVVYDYPLLAAPRDARLHWSPLAEDEMAAALPAGHPLAAADQVSLASLAGEPWVASHPSVCRDALEHACRQTGFAPDVVSDTNDYLAMLGMVAAGVGVAVVPRLIAVSSLPAGVALRPLTANPLRRTVAAVTGRSGHRPPLRDRMVAILAASIGELAHPDLPMSAPGQPDRRRSTRPERQLARAATG